MLTADRLSCPSGLFLFKLFVGAFAVRFGVDWWTFTDHNVVDEIDSGL